MSDPLQALNVELTGHDATRQLLPPAKYPLVIQDLEVLDNKDKTGKNLLITFATTTPVESTRGKLIPSGQKLKKYFPLQASAKQIEAGTPDSWKDRIALLLDAVFNTSETNRPNLNMETAVAMKGKVVIGDISIRSDDPAFGEQNDVGTVLPLV